MQPWYIIAEAIRQSASGDPLDQGQEMSENTPAYKLPYPEWKKRFEEFLAKRRATNPNFDDRRESMYLDRS